MMAAMTALTLTRQPAISGLTVAIMQIAMVTARHGGSTFQVVVVSTWKLALEVALMRPASVPGRRSAK